MAAAPSRVFERAAAACAVLLSMAGVLVLGLGFLNAPMADALGEGRGVTLLYYTIYQGVGALSLSLLAGPLVRRFGIARTVLIGGLWTAAVLVGMSRVGALPQLYLLAAGLGAFIPIVANYLPPLIVTRSFRRRQGTVLGLVFGLSGVGGMLIGFLMPRVVGGGNWPGGFVALAVYVAAVTVVPGLVLLRLVPPGRETREVADAPASPAPGGDSASSSPPGGASASPSPSGGVSASSAAPGGGPGLSSPPTGAPAGGVRPLPRSPSPPDPGRPTGPARHRRLVLAVLLVALVAFHLTQGIYQHFAPVMAEHGADLSTAGGLVASTSFVIMLASPVVGWAADRLGVLAVSAGLLAVYGAAFVAIWAARDAGALVVPVVGFAIGTTTPFVLTAILVRRLLGAEGFERHLALATACLPVGSALGAPLWGAVVDATGNYDAGLLGSAVVVAVLIALLGVARVAVPVRG